MDLHSIILAIYMLLFLNRKYIFFSFSLCDWLFERSINFYEGLDTRILRNRGSSMLRISILRQRTSSLLTILRFSFSLSFSLLAPSCFSSPVVFVTHYEHKIVLRPVKMDQWNRVGCEVPGSPELWLASVTRVDVYSRILCVLS